MKRRLFIIITLFCIANTVIITSLQAAGSKKIVPAPLPVNIAPTGYTGDTWGIGYNFMRLKTEWIDDFYIFEGDETIGDLQTDVHNIAISWFENSAGQSSEETTILLGIVKSTGKERYYSKDMANTTITWNTNPINPWNDATFEGSGYDAGVRLLWSRRLFEKSDSSFIDWNYAYSIHAAIFYLENDVTSQTIDGYWREEYEEEEWGLFLRPVVALQPKMHLSDSIVFIPYIGVGTMLITSSWYWWNVGDFIEDGTTQNGQKAEGSGTTTSFSGIETYIGFDVAIIINEAEGNSISLGGVFSRFFAGPETDFFEFHAIYTLPW